MLVFVIKDQSNRAAADLRRKLVGRLAHGGSTFSGVGASGKPGAVHAGKAAPKPHVARIALTLAVAGCLQAVSGLAQTPQDWAHCLGQDLSSADFPIQGCTAVIQAGRQMLDQLATAYNNRGVAYRIKGEYDKAIDDFEAIKLRPGFANAFNNRGVAHRNNGDLNGAL